MFIIITMKNIVKTLITGASFCFLVCNASALTIPIAGTSSGIFQNPVPGADNPTPTYAGVGTATFSWGAGGDPSSMTYTPVSPFSGGLETPFTIGNLYYYNGSINPGSGADGVTLNLALTLTQPTGVSQVFLYTMQLVNTSNTGDPYASADYVILSTFPNSTFTIDSSTYTLTLGFGTATGGGVVDNGGNYFHVYEDASASAPLIGTITSDISGVPDGGSTVALLAFGIAVLVCSQRRIVSSTRA
jgi:hypothetical protein